MTDQRPETAHDVPRVVFAQRVIEKIVKGALLYPGTETGEALIGLKVLQPGRAEPDIYVLDTIGPGEAAVREWGMFEQGDDWQGDVLHWLHVNWEAVRKHRETPSGTALDAKWNVPLAHVGDWHKQPGDMIAPSGGDAETARLMIADLETPVKHIVAPIVTMYPLRPGVVPPGDDTPVAAATDGAPVTVPDPTATADDDAPETPDTPDTPATQAADPTLAAGTAAHAVPESDATPDAAAEAAAAEPAALPETDAVPRLGRAGMPEQQPNTIIRTLENQGWIIRVDCWYMSEQTPAFVAVNPEIWADDRLPDLPPLAWHLAYPRRFDQEFKLLADAGYMVDVVRWDADGKPPYEICFSVYKRGHSKVILFVTPVDYPVEMPAIRLAPLVPVNDDEDVFTKLYEASEPVLMTDLPDWDWDSKRTLIELVWHIEAVLAKREKQPGGAE